MNPGDTVIIRIVDNGFVIEHTDVSNNFAVNTYIAKSFAQVLKKLKEINKQEVTVELPALRV